MMKKDLFTIDQTTLVLILAYSVLLFVPETMLVGKLNWPVYLLTLVFNFAFYLSLSYPLCLVGRWGGRKFEKAWHVFWHVVVYLFSASNVFLYIFFGLCWDAFTIALINETNQSEVSGFAATYFTDGKFYWIVLFYAVLGIIEVIFLKRSNRQSVSMGKWRWLLIPIFLLMWCHCIVFSTDYDWNYDMAKGTPIKRNILWKLEQSVLVFAENQKDYDTCALHQKDISIDSCSFRSPTIVVIVGESYIKQHSSLYGYAKETNPRLSEEKNLMVFNDVIAPFNLTSECFKYFLSVASVDDKCKWCEVPLFPALFRMAGYRVTFYSNQFVRGTHQERFDAKSGFIYHPAIEPSIIDERNREKFSHDGELVELFKRNHSQVESAPYNLIFFHLYGQHVKSKDRYPATFNHFRAADYADRTDLTEEQRQEVAEYDNATRYNDHVVSNIIDEFRDKDAIVLYFADHGDEANDYRPKLGRSFDFDKMSAKGIHCQFDIPFMIYVSDLYKQHHADIIQAIEASAKRRFMTDDLPHLMMFLAGIECQWYKPQRNLLSPDYQGQRQRLISAEKIDYDKFCSTH